MFVWPSGPRAYVSLRLSVPAAFVVWLIALLFPFYGKKICKCHQLALRICVSRCASSHFTSTRCAFENENGRLPCCCMGACQKLTEQAPSVWLQTQSMQSWALLAMASQPLSFQLSTTCGCIGALRPGRLASNLHPGVFKVLCDTFSPFRTQCWCRDCSSTIKISLSWAF